MLKPVIMAGEVVRRADNVLVRVEADNDFVGWGEAASAPIMTGDTLESIVSAVHYLDPVLRGRDGADIAGALAAMDGRMYGNHGAKAAIEIALHDLAGRAAGNDAARTRAICKLLGPGLLISADANQGYTTEQAIDYVRAVKGCGLDFFEQPVVADDLAGMAAVAAAAPEIAIGADEGIHSLADIARHHERKAARGVSLKAIKLGGIRAVVEAGKLCDSLGMSVNISCKTGESSIACAAALHVASVIPNIAWGLTLTHSGLAEDVTAHPIRTDKGHADSIERPGLGIDVDEDRVRRHRVQIATRNVA